MLVRCLSCSAIALARSSFRPPARLENPEGSLVCRVHQPAGHDARFQVAPDQPEHPLVVDASGDPGHQCVVLNAIEKRVEIKKSAHHAASSAMNWRARSTAGCCERPGRKPKLWGWKCGSKMGVSTCDGLADQSIHRSRHPQHPQSTRGLGDHHPAHRLRPVSARIERRADLWPVVFQPRPQLLVLIPSMPAAPAFCSTRLSASARFSRAMICSHKPAAAGRATVPSGAGSLLRSGWGTSGFTLGPSLPGPRRGWLRSMQQPRARTSWRSASRSVLPGDLRSRR
jgi:hypothetical protein